MRTLTLDYVNRLLTHCGTDAEYDTATALMRRDHITAAELNARRADPNRPIYLKANPTLNIRPS